LTGHSFQTCPTVGPEGDTILTLRTMGPQQTIAHYRVTAKLGEGGMGEVWRATDTKLHREVAIKVLPGALARDGEHMARFRREAQVLASLNHPNIASIYGVEEHALVMELVDGPTLAERITQGPIPLDDALPIASQIAEAMEYAHERGVIHRDLKPANIKVTPQGRVKVLDFGLAKAMSNEAIAGNQASSPTLTMSTPEAGVIVGTAAYMSPEQAKGKPVDRRVDIWAFGVVLVEMLTARRMYGGETFSETLASVIKDVPDLSVLPAATPPAIRKLLQRCLEKDPWRRLRDIGEARVTLEGPAEEISLPAAPPVRAGRTRPLQVAAVVLALTIALAMIWRATRPLNRPLMRFSADPSPDLAPGAHITAVISPDGTRIVYPVRSAGAPQLATRLLNQSQATILSGTDGAVDPFFAPDGQWIGFFAGGKMKKTSLEGGAPVTLVETSGPGARGAWWGEDGSIIATLDVRHLFRVPDAGGKAEMLAAKPEPKGFISYRWPQILPGGETVLVTANTTPASFEDATIAAVSLKTGDLKVLAHGGYFGRYLPSGHLTYVHQGTLFAVAFDARRLETRGVPAPILEDMVGNTTAGAGQLSFSRTGTLVYLSSESGSGARTVEWMDATGKKLPLLTATGAVLTPRLSPDGTRLALAVDGDISVYDAGSGATTRITFTHAPNWFPVWTPDNKHIVYAASTGGIWWTRADGFGQPEQILKTPGRAVPGSFSPDGERLALHQYGEGGNRDIWILPLDTADPDHPKPGKLELFVRTPTAADVEPAFSPDGRWLAYTSNESGSPQIYVRPYPEGAAGGGKWQISTAPGEFSIWSPNGRELFYVTLDGHIMVADYTANGNTFNPGKPRQWCETPILLTGGYRPFDLAADGKRFAIFPTAETAGDQKGSPHLTFLVNFFDELKRRLP
jgi:Tol biopolymer transport system component/predicted Ser/Thr protein kinase